jgi:hypothetical protein
VIRATWARRERNQEQENDDYDAMRVVFAIGTSSNRTINALVQAEASLHNDLLQEDFVDSYRNLTLKTLMIFKWAAEKCPGVRYILRINDDVVVNSPRLLGYLASRRQASKSQQMAKSSSLNRDGIDNGNHREVDMNEEPEDMIMMCNLYEKSRIDRKPTAKFYVSPAEWNQSRFYPYCEGSAYILTPRLAARLYQVSVHVRWPPFSTWLEDIYVGMLATYLRVRFVSMLPHFSSLVQYSETSLWRVRRDLWWRKYVSAVLNRLGRLVMSGGGDGNTSEHELFFVYVKRTSEDMGPVWSLLNEYN